MKNIIIETDELLEKDIAKQLVVDFIKSVARSLHNSELVPFDVFSYSEAMDALLYDICFFSFASMEDRGGKVIKEKTYLFEPVYWCKEQGNGSDGVVEYFLGKTALHGIEDVDVRKAIGILREELS